MFVEEPQQHITGTSHPHTNTAILSSQATYAWEIFTHTHRVPSHMQFLEQLVKKPQENYSHTPAGKQKISTET